MNRQEQLYSNIKLLTKLTIFFTFILIVCLIIDFFLPSKEDSDFTEMTETTELLGEIIEEKDPISEKHFEKILSSKLIGTTSLNLNQSNNFTQNYNMNKALMAINNNYIVYSQYNHNTESFDLILIDKKTKETTCILKNSNAHFLHIYEDFIFGVYDVNYKKGIRLDCIFIYNINKNIFTVYNKELGINTSRNISSFITNGSDFFFTEYLNDTIYSLSIDGKKIKRITRIEQQSIFDAPFLINLENNKLEIKTNYAKYFYNLKTQEIEKTSLESYFPNCKFKEQEIKIFTDKNSDFNLQINNSIIYTGNINAFNISDKIYFSDNNKLYAYDNVLMLIYEAQTTISQIYLFENDIILQLQGGTYEIYR